MTKTPNYAAPSMKAVAITPRITLLEGSGGSQTERYTYSTSTHSGDDDFE